MSLTPLLGLINANVSCVVSRVELCRVLRLSAGSSDSRWTLCFTKNSNCYPRVEQHLHDCMVCLLSLRTLVSKISTYRSHTRISRSYGHAPSLGHTEGPRSRPTVRTPCITFTREPGPDFGPSQHQILVLDCQICAESTIQFRFKRVPFAFERDCRQGRDAFIEILTMGTQVTGAPR